jgi:hypothetical protein
MRCTDRRVAPLFFAALALGAGCRPKKPPLAKRVWLGPTGGCVATPVHETSGTFACWGLNQAAELGGGATTARPFATRMRFDAGDPRELTLGGRHACGVFGHRVDCWGEGARGELGGAAARTERPVRASNDAEEASPTIAVGVGGQHTCIGTLDGLRCFGANDEGQLGGDWGRGAKIRSFALGERFTCAAYAGSSAGPDSIVCHGRAPAAPSAPLLVGVSVGELAAGGEHACALLGDGTVSCWGENDAGQLGDGTTIDAATPVSVPGLNGVIQVAAGRRHTCVLLHDGLIACWGANEHHQLAIGTTEPSTRPRVVVGLVGGKEIVAAGDGTCARLEGGYVRCWGRNDASQLGSGSRDEASVPVQILFR